VVLGAAPEVLIDGVITHHQVRPDNRPGASTLTVTGTDLTTLLDLEERNEHYRNQPDAVIVTRLLGGYPQLGFVPAVTPTTDVPIELDRIPHQHETDLRFIQRMARRNGFVFYLEPVAFGVNTAFWGPETRTGVPQPALSIDLGAATNVETLSFTEDALTPVGAEGSFIDPFAKLTIPVPALPPLRLPPLAASATPARRTVLLRKVGNANPAQAALSSAAAATKEPEPVGAEGVLDTIRYGSVLRSRRPVGVRGAGATHDGNYYVRSVTHEIVRGRYTQRFSLSREGTGALLPVVRP
jgi:phage protein D